MAGFHVTGVDIVAQKRYAGDVFIQAEALAFCREHGHEFDVIHASPPCQHYSRATAWRGDRATHPDLIAATREALLAAGRPFVIENVEDARRLLTSPIMLCGSGFGLRVRRHRYFELSPPVLLLTPPCRHRSADYVHDHGGTQTESVYRDAMGCDWMTAREAREAIPPAYTQFIGTAMMAVIASHPAAEHLTAGDVWWACQ
jgi:DNA (cytosine-5)-methyltransferase 1